MGIFDRIFGRKLPQNNHAQSPRSGTLTLEELGRRLGLPGQQLASVEPRYHEFTVPKRAGGLRKILAPDPELKLIQRLILRRVLARLRVHPAAHGFEGGRSIVTNAMPHAGRDVVVRLDLKDFFPSIAAQRIEAYFRAIGWDAAAAKLLANLCTHDGCLPQGAPTSPRLSNLVNFRLDTRLAALAQSMHAGYTRYADDMTFSMAAKPEDPHAANSLIYAVKSITAEEGYSLHIHKKLRIQRSHDRQMVSGLVVNRQVALPRAIRRWLRAVEHHTEKNQPATLTKQQLQGWQALRSMVENQSRGTSPSP